MLELNFTTITTDIAEPSEINQEDGEYVAEKDTEKFTAENTKLDTTEEDTTDTAKLFLEKSENLLEKLEYVAIKTDQEKLYVTEEDIDTTLDTS